MFALWELRRVSLAQDQLIQRCVHIHHCLVVYCIYEWYLHFWYIIVCICVYKITCHYQCTSCSLYYIQ